MAFYAFGLANSLLIEIVTIIMVFKTCQPLEQLLISGSHFAGIHEEMLVCAKSGPASRNSNMSALARKMKYGQSHIEMPSTRTSIYSETKSFLT